LTGAQSLLQRLQHPEVALEFRQLPLLPERLVEPLQVARGVVHVGLFDLDVVQSDRRVELDVADLGALAHHLLVHLAVGRHVDDDIAAELRLA
jgi:hypothetical protein